MSDQEGGEFLTKVDIYFFAKETNRAVTLQIRTVENGYPSKTILPFSTVVKEEADITISATADDSYYFYISFTSICKARGRILCSAFR